MRLGAYPAILKKGSLVHKLYGENKVFERHRHRYEVNPDYVKEIEKGGLVFSGRSPDGILMEFMERIKKRVTLCASSTVRIPKMREHAVRQHHDMIDLLDQRDAQGAEDLMKIHIQSAKQAFLRHYQQGQKSRKTDD